MPTQNFENHTKFVPGFVFGVLAIFAVNLVSSVVRVVQFPSVGNVINTLTAVGLVLCGIYARRFALVVQDRVIRLEMHLRMERLLPADLRGRIAEFSVGQLVSLRFAGDAELPELARKVLDGKIEDRKAIKQMVRDWQPDWLRA